MLSAANRTARFAPRTQQQSCSSSASNLLLHTRLLSCRKYSSAPSSSSQSSSAPSTSVDLSVFPTENIRNFSIIAHIDHGKSTLADRLLEMTGTIRHSARGGDDEPKFSDKLEVEQERGITVKAKTCAIIYKHTDGKTYLLNLIDTPGHVDFQYEVSRSLSACQAVLLLVDAAQGIQAQTLAHFYGSLEQNLTIIPIITKIDQETAQPEIVAKDMVDTFGVLPEEILRVSAKSGLNCDKILPTIIERSNSPSGSRDKPLKALIFDSWFDEYFGVVCLVYIAEGTLNATDSIAMFSTFKHDYALSPSVTKLSPAKKLQDLVMYEITGLGVLRPKQTAAPALYAGQVGYITCGMKSTKEARIGDTVFKPLEIYPEAFTLNKQSQAVVAAEAAAAAAAATAAGTGSASTSAVSRYDPLPGFKPAKPMVFAGIYPADSADYESLRDAIDKLLLNDSSVSVAKESSAALGMGFRCGFLGLLHMDVFKIRLEQEFAAEVIITAPTVPYQVKLMNSEERLVIDNPNGFPVDYQAKFESIAEPMVAAQIMCPVEYIGTVLELCQEKRGMQTGLNYLTPTRVQIQYTLPLNEILHDFFDRLKSITRGYASLEYEDAGFQESDLVKMTVSLNGEPVDAMSFIVHRSMSYRKGREVVDKLKDVISRQMFEVSIQASIGQKVIASERLKAYRKNVLAKCYGGDVTRKKKLLEKQKAGKKKMKQLGSVNVPHEAFLHVFSAHNKGHDDDSD